MKPTRSLILMAAALALAVFLIVLLIPNNKKYAKPNTHPNVSIQFDSPIDVSSIETDPKIINGTIENATPQTIPKPDATTNEDRPALSVRIRDVADETIPDGYITIDGKQRAFHDGRVFIFDLEKRTYTLSATAEGYRSAAQTVDANETKEVDIVLDYTTRYDIVVYQDKERQTRLPNATVSIIQGAPAPRPIAQIQKISIDPINKPPSFATFTKKDRSLQITDSQFVLDAYERKNGVALELGLRIPQVGDVLFSVGLCPWSPSPSNFDSMTKNYFKRYASLPLTKTNSPHARIMDVLSLTAPPTHKGLKYDKIVLETESGLGRANFHFPNPPLEPTVATTLTTDERGQCRVEGLTPGLYYARAQYKNLLSNFEILHPAKGGVILEMAPNAELAVFAKLAGTPPNLNMKSTNISGVDIHLKPAKDGGGTGLFSCKTDSNGKAKIEGVPFGRYQLSAVPPETLEIPPIKKTVDIIKPNQAIEVLFDGWKKLNIRGRVVLLDTKEPVPDYSVQLLEQRPGGFFGVGTSTTDHDGNYQFTNLPSGAYQINHKIVDYDRLIYSPARDPMERSPRTASYRIHNEYVPVTLGDEDVNGVTLWVVRNNRTRLMGTVVDERGNPIKGARISIRSNTPPLDSLQTTEITPITDDEGRFDVTVITKSDVPKDRITQIQIRALLAQVIPPQWVPIKRLGKTYGKTLAEEKLIPLAKGSQTTDFSIGETVSGIRIVARAIEHKTLEGIVRGEGGQVLDDMEIRLKQNASEIPVDVGKNGYFKVAGITDGPFTLIVHDAYRTDPSAPFGNQMYDSEEIVLQIPQDKQQMNVEITLDEIGFIEGVVLGKDASPVVDARVLTQTQDGETRERMTNNEGRFILRVPNQGSYSLSVAKKDNNRPIECLTDIPVNTQNVIVRLE